MQRIDDMVQYAALDAAGPSKVFIALIWSLQCLLPREACPLVWQVTSCLGICALTELQDRQSKQSPLKKHGFF